MEEALVNPLEKGAKNMYSLVYRLLPCKKQEA